MEKIIAAGKSLGWHPFIAPAAIARGAARLCQIRLLRRRRLPHQCQELDGANDNSESHESRQIQRPYRSPRDDDRASANFTSSRLGCM
jgi:hypothetical protein